MAEADVYLLGNSLSFEKNHGGLLVAEGIVTLGKRGLKIKSR
jgi:hypothetical protein